MGSEISGATLSGNANVPLPIGIGSVNLPLTQTFDKAGYQEFNGGILAFADLFMNKSGEQTQMARAE